LTIDERISRQNVYKFNESSISNTRKSLAHINTGMENVISTAAGAAAVAADEVMGKLCSAGAL